MTTDQPIFVSVEEARRILGGICKTRAYELMNRGDLVSVKLGKRRLIRMDSIRSFASTLAQGDRS